MLRQRLGLRQVLDDIVGLLVVALLAMVPLWRHRVLVHRPPYEVDFALHDIIAYTSDYVSILLLSVGWTSLLLSKRRRRRLSLGPWFVTLPLSGLALLVAVSAVWAVDQTYAVYQAGRFLLWLALYLLLANLDISRTWLLGGVVFGIVIQSSVGLGQVLLGRSLGLQRLGEIALDPDWWGISVVFTDSGRHLRAYGLTQHPNLLGGLMGAYLLMLTGLFVMQRECVGRWVLGGLCGVYALGTAVLLMTFSRGSWLAVLAGGVALFGLLIASGKHAPANVVGALAAPMVAILLVAALFVVSQWELLRPRLGLTYQGAEIRSVDERATLIDGARALRQLRPWLGVGAGGFSTALFALAPESISDYPIFQPVHRVPLLVSVELGPLGSALWIGLMLAPLIWLVLGSKGRMVTPWLAALTAVLVSFFAVAWVEAYPWSSHQGALMTWVVLGLWGQEYRNLNVSTIGGYGNG